MVFANEILSSPNPLLSYVAQYRAEHAFVPSPPHRHAQQLADEHFVLAVIHFFALPSSFARGLVLLPAVELALPVTEQCLVAACAQSQHPRRSSLGLAGEARRVGHRGRARVELFSGCDLLLLGAVVRVDGVFEAHERE